MALLFSSMEFVLFFLPVVLGIYFLLPLRFRNYWLLLGSLFFYAWGEPKYVLIMLFSIVINYLMALRIEELPKGSASKKAVLAVNVSINLAILFVFKYLNFVISILHNAIPATQNLFPQTEIPLPIGISFFTFQALSYVIDVYRGGPAQRNMGYLGLYISMFPQLIAGPIVRYSTIMEQITNRRVSLDSFCQGLLRFMIGFNKKILLANTLANVADLTFSASNNSVLTAWLGSVCYTLQILFDFSGYSDMAIGLGRMLGFEFPENFNYPYISRTITEFWRRWHISLGTWFRDYVYFPLGGSRVDGKPRLMRNLMVVWLLTGIWHGANWTFVVWGIIYGVIIIAEKLTGIPKRIMNWRPAARIGYRVLTLLLVMIGWVFFRAESLKDALAYLGSMFALSGNAFADSVFRFNAREYIVFLIFGILCATPLFERVRNRLVTAGGWRREAALCVHYGLQFALFIFSFTFLVMKAHNPFIYFNF